MKESQGGRFLIGLLVVLSTLGPIGGCSLYFALETKVVVVYNPGNVKHEKYLFKNTYNDSLKLEWGEQYIYNLTDDTLWLFTVQYPGDGYKKKICEISPRSFVKTEKIPDYYFTDPLVKIYVARRKGDNKPEVVYYLDVK